jgi:hypothetical protein
MRTAWLRISVGKEGYWGVSVPDATGHVDLVVALLEIADRVLTAAGWKTNRSLPTVAQA